MEWEYFQWLIESIDPNHVAMDSYQPVFEELYLTDFRWLSRYSDDENRARDGVYLRNLFAESKGINVSEIGIQWKRCSCLEMLVSLARRIEYEIIAVPGEENVPRWFWMFMKNLGLGINESRVRDQIYVTNCIQQWLNRKYEKNGIGGIFVSNSDNFDMPRMTIWKQMNAIVNEKTGYFDEF